MKKIILFTRVPKEGTTKTRLYDFITPKEAVLLQEKILKKLYIDLKKWNFDITVFHNGNKNDDKYMKNLLGEEKFLYQKGKTLGEKMNNAIEELFSSDKKIKKIILIGSDIVNISEKILMTAFEKLNNNDIVINPTYDGGYYLIGMKKPNKNIFNIVEYGVNNVFENTLKNIKNNNLKYFVGGKCLDIDTKEDLLTLETNFKNIKLLGSGEYNLNFIYDYKNYEKRVLRLNMKSQMNLKRQIAYEYETLKLLEKSTVTPKVYSINEEKKYIPYDYLTMEYLKGRALDYNNDMQIATYLLSKVHNMKFDIDKVKLIIEKNPFLAMYEECFNMAENYLSWEKGDKKVKKYLIKFLSICENMLDDNYTAEKLCIINTELNSGNFIIGNNKKDSYIIDWEKAIIGECEQDLAHFLAPTTTFWKTDKILNKNEIEKFLEEYNNYREYDIKKFNKYLIFTCLRGITWCSMAYKEYILKDKILTDEFTFNKIKEYLSYEFLYKIEKYFN